ncbi:LytTR family DNA-binding domain-containing protein [Cucumibacter marinus]|uniref:LytTR family DNA-binding domain-containing protein n=1 Tax=Cucumibacter marinus TaxID=1121252 RepID=UPI000410C17D|nr:LytTR family DNA-binding domain-containing protein [Cucumibacter marinus]
MGDNALQLTLREMRSSMTQPAFAGIFVLVALILGLSGPFGTFDYLPIGPRLVYWVVLLATAYVTGHFFGAFTLRLVEHRFKSMMLGVVVGGVAAGLPVSFVVWAINAMTFGVLYADPAALLLNTVYCVIISIAVVAGFAMVESRAGTVAEAGEAGAVAEAPPRPKLLDRLAVQDRGALLSLSVSDHYVEVVTDKGKTLLLMRLGDAIDEAAPIPGIQLHRSHWVALDAIRSARRHKGAAVVVLTDGRELPISRGRLEAAREAGILT